ncbi:MAG TPA: cytochrome b/b6 domain-containing protein [Spirochaetia bacterium]|nr:cytochrome b/b6 domain-containing protein [Spirochaetia bacterium]
MNKRSYARKNPIRHNPFTVTLHWLTALIVLAETLIGVGLLHFLPNNAGKVVPLTVHMILGIGLVVTVLLQLLSRSSTPRPTPSATGNSFLDFVAKVTHALLYLFALLAGGSGVLLALQAHVLRLVIGKPISLPMGFEPFVHAAIFVVFGMLVGLHVLGAVYHQFILKDSLLSRMGYSRTSTVEQD